MKKRKAGILYALAASVFFTAVFPINTVYATEQQETEGETTQETEYPESYFLPIESNAVEGWPAGPQVEGEAAVVMDAETGTFLYSKNMEAKEYPASITKIMTTLVALEHGKLNSKVKFSEWSVNSLEADSSRLWMNAGEWITLKQALYGIMLVSANDCANAVAEKIGGSEEGFAELMNQKAAELGCVNTHFVNAHGLHNENHYTCARDMALIMRAAMENEMFAEIAKTIEYTIPKSKHVREEHVMVTHQKMLFREGFRYKGCLGGKTGFTEAALNTLVTVAQRKGRRLICVIMRTNGPDKICWETRDLLDYGFKKFKREEIPIADGRVTRQDIMGHAIFGKASVMNAPALSESMVFTAGSAMVSIPKGTDAGAVKQTFCEGNKFSYIFNGWQVGEVPAVFNTVDIEIPEWNLINTDLSAGSIELETENAGFGKDAEGMLESIKAGWDSAWKWIYEHDIAAALAGLVLIILLLPMLVIAYIRNRNSQKIRKQRQREREERTRIEKDIDSKSISEIEAELRAGLEKHRQEQEKTEQDISEEKKEE
ncbi:D-alanyl-D-alanine carboxypeptidase family protein [Lachnospiraceae bacterium 46-15]